MLSRADSDFLVRLGREIDKRTGAKVSRSEIVRASIAGMRELHRLAPLRPARFSPLAACKNETALAVAAWLEKHPRIERVWYPGLRSHPDHEIARKQMTGFGGVISFEVRGKLEDASRFIDRLEIPSIAPSLGGGDSLLEQPALMSFFEKTTEERLELGIKDNLVRFALGIEDAADLVADLEQALAD